MIPRGIPNFSIPIDMLSACYDCWMDRRSDYKTALIIDAVIHEAAAEARPAARELATLGVPLEVSLRVLTRPAERRHQVTPDDLRNAP